MNIKRIFRRVCIYSLVLAAVADGDEEKWRVFKNADASRTFTARVIAYDAVGNKATLAIQNRSKPVVVSLTRLQDEDQTFVRLQAKLLAVKRDLELEFDMFMDRKERSENDSRDTTTTTYDGGCRISLSNNSALNVEDLKIEHILVWRKDSFDGLGDSQVVTGSQQLASIAARSKKELTIGGIVMESKTKRGDSSTAFSTRRVGSGCGATTRTTATTFSHTLRSRDKLVGCVVKISVCGEVAKTAASSDSLLKKYKDQFQDTP